MARAGPLKPMAAIMLRPVAALRMVSDRARTHALQQLDGRSERAIRWKCGSPAQLLCPLQVGGLQRDRADALAGCSKDRVAERARHERWMRHANAAPESLRSP